MSEITRKKQMKKVPQIEVPTRTRNNRFSFLNTRMELKSKRYSKSNGYSMKKGEWNAGKK